MNRYECLNKKCDNYNTCCKFKCNNCEFNQECKSKDNICSYLNNKIDDLKASDKIIVTNKLNDTYTYEFIRFNPLDTQREIILKNLTNNTITEVERLWLQFREIEWLN